MLTNTLTLSNPLYPIEDKQHEQTKQTVFNDKHWSTQHLKTKQTKE